MALLALAALAAAFFASAPAAATEITGDLVVTGTDARSNETITITGSVVVAGSGFLDWTDVVLEFNGTGQPGYGLHVDGSALLVRVTVRTVPGADPYLFLVNSTASFVMESSDVSGTAGVGSDPGASGTPAGTDFASLRGGVQLYTSQAVIGNSTIHDGDGVLLYIEDASPRVVANHIHSSRYLAYMVSSSFSSGTQTSNWRALASCIVVSGGAPDLDTNRVDRCGLDGSANATDVGTMGATNAVSHLYLVSSGLVAMGGAPSLRLATTTDVGLIGAPSASFTIPGPVNVTHNYYRVISWGMLYKNTGDVSISGGWVSNAVVPVEFYLDAAFPGAAPAVDIGPFAVNGTFVHGVRFTVASVGVGASMVLNQLSVTGGTGTAVSAQFINVPAPHGITVVSSTLAYATGGGQGLYVQDTGSSGAPSISVHHTTFIEILAPITVSLTTLSGGANIEVHNNTVSLTAGVFNSTCCSGDLATRGAIDVRAVSLTGGGLVVRVEDNRVYNQSWTLAGAQMYPGITLYNSGSTVASTLTMARNDISNISHGMRIYENYGSNPLNSTYIIVGNRVSISDGNGLYVYANSLLGTIDPVFDSNIFDRPGADFASGYGAYWQINSATMSTQTFGNITVYGNGTRTIQALRFNYNPTAPLWIFNLDNLLITNMTDNIGIYLRRSTVSIYNSNLSGAGTAVSCQECTARLVDCDVYPLSATVSTNGEVKAFQQFGGRRVQWQGDGGLLIPNGNLYLQWRGPFNVQTLTTLPFVGGRVDNASVPMWRRTVSIQDEYANLTPVFRQGSGDLPGVQIPFTRPYYGNVTIIDPELPVLTYSTPFDNSQIRAREVVVKGRVRDTTTGVAGVQISADGVNFQNVSTFDRQQGTWETRLTFSDDGDYNITLHAWDRARWAITFGNYSTGFKEVVITGIVIDTVAPEIYFTSPSGDLTQNSTSISVGGQVQELNPLSVFRVTFNGADMGTQLGIGGLFSLVIYNLTEGPNQVSVIATDGAGNTNVASRTITLDTIPPHLVILGPVNGSSTNRAVVTVTGEVEQGVTLKVNGLYATLPHPVPLNAGMNVIIIIAEDRGKNQASVVRMITLDTQPPSVTFLVPSEFPFDTQQARLVLQATANEPLKSVTLNNITYPLTTPTSFTVEIYLDDGTHILVLTVTDLANNTAEVSPAPVIRVDTVAPALYVDSPADGSVQSDRLVVICGRTDRNAGLNVTGPLGRFQIPLTNPLTGEFCFEDTRTADGTFVYTLETTDAVGNTRVQSLEVVVDTTPPTIDVLGLPTNSETSDPYLQLRGSVSPDVALTVNGTPVAVQCNPGDPLGLCSFDLIVPLGVGQSTLTLLATDEAGNVQARNFFIMREAPEVVVPFDVAPLLITAGLVLGLVLLAVFWVRLHGEAAAAYPGLGGEKAAAKQEKREERKRKASTQPEVIYEADSQAMYRDDFDARRPGGGSQ